MSNAENSFHLTVALHHMRAIAINLLPVEQVRSYTKAMKHLEGMVVANKKVEIHD